MLTIDDYIEQAKAAHGFASDVELGRALGLSKATVCHWRTKRAWPEDATMIALATLAKRQIDAALIDLNYWRAPSSAKTIYQELAKKIAAAAAVFILSITFGATSFAKEPSANRVTSPVRSLYIMANRRLRARLKHLATKLYVSCKIFSANLSRI